MSPSKKEEPGTANTQARVIPIYKTVNIEGMSPDLAWVRSCSTERYSFLLESIEGEEKVARYSFLGWDPFLIFRSKGAMIEIFRGAARETLEGNPIKVLKDIINEFSSVKDENLPRFSCGAVGYFSYDTVRFIEDLQDENPDDLSLPDSCFIFPRKLLIFDHKKGLLTIVRNVTKGCSREEERARQEIEKIISGLTSPYIEKKATAVGQSNRPKIETNFTQREFEKIVK